jgi:ribosomal-protein-alanine N-acetyltransferase
MIETARLLLRPFQADDLAAYAAIRAKPEVNRYLPGGEARAAEAWAVAERVIALFTAPDTQPLPWAVVEKASGRLIGHLGLRRLEELEGAVELLYMLDSAFWGEGLATEGAQAALDYGFDALKLDRIIGLALAENKASRRVLEKLGMTLAPDPVHAFSMTLTLYELTPAMR